MQDLIGMGGDEVPPLTKGSPREAELFWPRSDFLVTFEPSGGVWGGDKKQNSCVQEAARNPGLIK